MAKRKKTTKKSVRRSAKKAVTVSVSVAGDDDVITVVASRGSKKVRAMQHRRNDRALKEAIGRIVLEAAE